MVMMVVLMVVLMVGGDGLGGDDLGPGCDVSACDGGSNGDDCSRRCG